MRARPSTSLLRLVGDLDCGGPTPPFVSPLVGKTTDWRAGCGRSARPVRREGGRETGPPYPYHVWLLTRRSKDVEGRARFGHDA